MKSIVRMLAFALAMALTIAVSAGQIEIKLKDGSRWRGQANDKVQIEYMLRGVQVSMEGKLTKVEDLYVVVDGTFAGSAAKNTIFKSDIVTMKTVSGAPADAGTAVNGDAKPNLAGGAGAAASESGPQPAANNKNEPGVFVLPMTGTVGEAFRHDEIEKLAKHCDEYGPGQIIVLEIESGGGLEIEMTQIHKTIFEVRKRHRVIAWIKEAISAAAATANNCNEIYFRTTGTLGAMTGFNPATGQSLKGEELERWLKNAGDWMETGGRSRYIAEAMIDDAKLLSYDKDEATGEVTWHNDLSGAHILSDEKTNLVFTATTAMDSKFADGIADTPEQLAKLLNLPKWNEKDDYGRKIHKEWNDTVEQAKQRIPLLAAQLQYKNAHLGGKAQLGTQMGIIRELITWWDRCPNVCFLSGVPSKEELQQILENMKRQLSKMG